MQYEADAEQEAKSVESCPISTPLHLKNFSRSCTQSVDVVVIASGARNPQNERILQLLATPHSTNTKTRRFDVVYNKHTQYCTATLCKNYKVCTRNTPRTTARPIRIRLIGLTFKRTLTIQRTFECCSLTGFLWNYRYFSGPILIKPRREITFS